MALLLGLGVFAAYAAVSYAQVFSWDGNVMYALARNLVDHHTLTVPNPVRDQGHVVIPHNAGILRQNSPYSHYGIAVTVLVAVPYAVQEALGWQRPVLVTLALPAVLALASALVFLTCRALAVRRLPALAAGVAFGLLSLALPYSEELFSEPVVALGLALLLLGLVRWRDAARSGPALAGLGLATGLLARSDSLLLLGGALLALPLLLGGRRLLAPRPLLLFARPLVPAVVWTSWYAHVRDHAWWPTQYGGRFDHPFWRDLWGLTLGPGKGFFWYDPLLLLAVPGLVWLWRRDRGMALALVLTAVARPLLYARWQDWSGDLAWGPRFLLPSCVPMAVALGVALDRLTAAGAPARRLAATVVAALTAAGVAVSVLSVAVPYTAWFRVLYHQPGLSPRAQAAAARRRLPDSELHWRLSGINGARRLLGHVPTPFTHFAHGPSATGVLAALAAVGSLLIATGVAARRASRSTKV